MPATLKEPPHAAPAVYTIGHSTHPLAVFIEMLESYHLRLLADIRTLPGSRRVPWFNRENLAPALEEKGIGYVHLKGLGGLRRTTADSVNTGWRNKSFRGFADYMQTEDFKESLQELVRLANQQPTVIMCAEAVPWRCHRSLVGDALLVQGLPVIDIFSAGQAREHLLTSFAKVEGDSVIYP